MEEWKIAFSHSSILPIFQPSPSSPQLPIINHQSSIINHQSSIINYQLSIQKKGAYTMAIIVRIPTPLRKLTQNLSEVEGVGSDISSIIENLEANYPGLKERICDESGNVRRFVNIYLNDEDIRFRDGKVTAVKEGDEISIIPAIAGG